MSGNLQSVLYQLALPATGVLAWWFLNERFNVFHLTGSALVLGGCLAVALPPFISSEESHHSTATVRGFSWVVLDLLQMLLLSDPAFTHHRTSQQRQRRWLTAMPCNLAG